MNSPYGQYDAEIRRLIRQGCSQNQVLQALSQQYPGVYDQAAQVLKRIQAIERELRG